MLIACIGGLTLEIQKLNAVIYLAYSYLYHSLLMVDFYFVWNFQRHNLKRLKVVRGRMDVFVVELAVDGLTVLF